MQRVRQPNRMTIDADRAKALFETIRRRLQRGDGDHQSLKASVFQAFEKYFTQLAEPLLEPEPLVAVGCRSPRQYNEMIDTIKSDIEGAANDAKNLADSVVAAFNMSTTLVRQLDTTTKKVTSKSQDLQHLSEVFAEDTVVAGDDFADDSRIDRSAGLDAEPVEVPLNQNAVALRRIKSRNLLTDQDVKIRILSQFRVYEGLSHALRGEARPEGGRFHFSGTDFSKLSDSAAPGAPPDLLKRFRDWRTDPSLPSKIATPVGDMDRNDVTSQQGFTWAQSTGQWGPFTKREWDMLANNYHYDPVGGSDASVIDIGTPTVSVDRGASLEEREEGRKRMIDGNPDSFWEAEYIIDSSEALPANLVAQAETPAGRVRTMSQLIGTANPDAPATPAEGNDLVISMAELLNRMSDPAVDRMDLTLAVLLELPSVVTCNWINLLPHNFSDTAWLEVLNVSTSVDGSTFKPIEGISEQKFESILTDDVNSELTPEEVATTLAPNRFQYTGQGVWTFPPRAVRYVRIDLLQRTPIPAPYDILRLELEQTMTATHKGHRGTECTTYLQQDTKDLSYLETLKVYEGDRDPAGLETGPISQTNISRPAGHTTRDIVQDILDPGRFLHTKSEAASTTHEYSGWNVRNQYTVTKWDRARYAIGIKEIGVWSYEYASRSGFVSVPFKTPKPIRSVSLHTDEIIPKEFTGAIVRPWIKYWVAFGDGQDWQPIAPADEGAFNVADGIRIPQTIHVNSGIPEAERDMRSGYLDFDSAVNQVRLKAVLERPDDLIYMSPVLKRYRLRLVMRGGL